MTENHLSRAEATQILSEIKCLEDSKYGLPEPERRIWETLINNFEGIGAEITDANCTNLIPEVFRAFLDLLH